MVLTNEGSRLGNYLPSYLDILFCQKQMLEDLLDWNVSALHPMYLGPLIGLSNQVPTNNLQTWKITVRH